MRHIPYKDNRNVVYIRNSHMKGNRNDMCPYDRNCVVFYNHGDLIYGGIVYGRVACEKYGSMAYDWYGIRDCCVWACGTLSYGPNARVRIVASYQGDCACHVRMTCAHVCHVLLRHAHVYHVLLNRAHTDAFLVYGVQHV